MTRNDSLLLALRICWLIILGGFLLYAVLRFLFEVVPVFTFIVVGATFFAYLIHPVVARLHRRLPMALSILTTYACLALVIGFGIYIIYPVLVRDAQDLGRDAPTLVAAGQRMLTDPRDPVTAHLPEPVHRYVLSIPGRIEQSVSAYALAIASKFVAVFVSIVSVLALFVVIPAVAAYMTAESRTIKRSLLGLLPRRARMRAARIIADLDHVVGGFIRGQLLVALIVGTLVTLLLLGLHVPYAFLIGLAAGVFDVVPYVGAVAGWLPAFISALLFNGAENALAVTAGIIVVNQIEGHLIVPNVVSRTVALTPLGVILALLVAGELLGLAGLIIAVPAAGVIRVLFVNLVTPAKRRSGPLPALERATVFWRRFVARPLSDALTAKPRSAARRRSTSRSR